MLQHFGLQRFLFEQVRRTSCKTAKILKNYFMITKKQQFTSIIKLMMGIQTGANIWQIKISYRFLKLNKIEN